MRASAAVAAAAPKDPWVTGPGSYLSLLKEAEELERRKKEVYNSKGKERGEGGGCR